MKKLLITILCRLPIASSAQWCIAPSGSVGMYDFKLEYKGVSEFKPDVGFSGDISLRYSIPFSKFYLFVGAGSGCGSSIGISSGCGLSAGISTSQGGMGFDSTVTANTHKQMAITGSISNLRRLLWVVLFFVIMANLLLMGD